MFDSVDKIIDALGGTGAVAEKLALSASTVSSWRARDSIPKDRWLSLVDFARSKRVKITLDALADLNARPARCEARA